MTLHQARTATATAPPVTPAPIANPVPDDDPFRFGCRYVTITHPDGRVTSEPVPLSEDEAWHPQEGDQVSENSQHSEWRSHIYEAFTARLAADPTAVVLSDTLVKWDHPDLRPTAPDATVILDVATRRVWGTFDVAAKRARVALALEIVSPTTAERDWGGKKDEYALAKVPVYVVIDAVSVAGAVRIEGYQLGPAGYEPLVPDERGWLWLAAVGLWLGVEGDRVRLYDRDGAPILTFQEQEAARAAAAGRAAAEAAARAVEAAARVRAEERAAQAQAQAAEAQAQAASEAAARVAAEARLQALEAELRRPRGEG